MIEVEIRLFGAFKKYGIHNNTIMIPLEQSTDIDGLKKMIESYFKNTISFFDDQGSLLVQDSALANETEILQSNEMIVRSSRLNLLPPVCGG